MHRVFHFVEKEKQPKVRTCVEFQAAVNDLAIWSGARNEKDWRTRDREAWIDTEGMEHEDVFSHINICQKASTTENVLNNQVGKMKKQIENNQVDSAS